MVPAMLFYGAAGFVGTALAGRIGQQCEREVVLVDQRSVPAGLLTQLASDGVRTVVHRATSLRMLPVLDDVRLAVVLAGQTDVDEALAHPVRAFERNIQIAIDVGEWLRTNPFVKLVYLSSDEVLGPSFMPLGEAAPPRPTQPYAASKAAAEVVLHNYRDTYGLNVVTVRSCNLIGGHQRARKLIPTAVTYLTRGKPVPVFGSGAHVREWLDVEDLCDAIALILRRPDAAGIYHCSSGVRLTVLEVIRLVAGALGVEPRWQHVSDRLVHDSSYAMDCSRVRKLGWSPRCDVAESIKRAAVAIAGAIAAGDNPLGAQRLQEVCHARTGRMACNAPRSPFDQ
jgi:dTDP-glucose 4,6-dehydratase